MCIAKFATALAARTEDLAELENTLKDHFVTPSPAQRHLMQQIDRWRSIIDQDFPALRYRLTSRQLHDALAREMGLLEHHTAAYGSLLAFR